MFKILLPRLGKLKKSEFIQFVKNKIAIYEQNKIDSPLLSNTLQELIQASGTLYKSHLSSTKHILTATLQDLDKKRLHALRSMKKMLEIFLNEDDVDIKETAQILFDDFTIHYNNIITSNRPGKTAAISTLGTKWQESQVQKEALNKLGLNVWLDKLITFNQKFDETYVQRVSTTVKKVSMAQKRAEITPVCLKLITETEAYAVMNPDEGNVKKLIETMNILCSKFNILLKMREAGTDTELVDEIPLDEESLVK